MISVYILILKEREYVSYRSDRENVCGCWCPYVMGVVMSYQGGYEKSAPFVIDEGADLCLKLSRKTDLSKVPPLTHGHADMKIKRLDIYMLYFITFYVCYVYLYMCMCVYDLHMYCCVYYMFTLHTCSLPILVSSRRPSVCTIVWPCLLTHFCGDVSC